MKYIFRLAVILGISMMGELLNAWIPLPIPGSIYGLLLMLAGLCSGIIPLEQVEGVGGFLIEIMPVMFIPAAVGLMDRWAELRSILIPVLVVLFVSTFLVMGVAGHVTQALMRAKDARREKEDV